MDSILALACAAAAAVQLPAAAVESLDWLEGHWRADETSARNEVRFTEEVWLEGIAGKMIGIGRSVRGRTTTAFEYMRIEQSEAGLTFVAQPNGAPPTRFPMIKHGRSEIVFENRATDYPQRVAYRREGDRLTATISLADGSKPMRWSFRRTRPD
jgi:hypothetical protein